MQILVVVAIIQMRTLKTEVEKGSMSTAFVHGLVDPKMRGNPLTAVNSLALHRKGIRLIFRNRKVDIVW